MTLTVQDYVRLEAAAEASVANRIITACRPGHFLQSGYPTAVRDQAALGRYFDVMHELRDSGDYVTLLNGFSPEEFDLFRAVSEQAAAFSEGILGRRMVPKGALTRAMLSFRHIRWLSPDAEATTVLEIGPGSGYLGALLASTGYRYVASDIAQAFYLHQSQLWEYLFGGRLIELASDPRGLDGFGDLAPGTILHVPWWKFMVARADAIGLKTNVVVANHALCEMSEASLYYTTALARQMLAGADGLSYFFVEGPGAQDLRNRRTMYRHFEASRYVRAFGDGGLIDVFVPGSKADRLITEGRKGVWVPSAYPPPPPDGLANPRYPLWLIGKTFDTLKRPGGLERLIDRAMTPFDKNRIYKFKGNQLSTAIETGRATHAAGRRIPFEQVRAFQAEIARGADILTDDELFLRYTFGS